MLELERIKRQTYVKNAKILYVTYSFCYVFVLSHYLMFYLSSWIAIFKQSHDALGVENFRIFFLIIWILKYCLFLICIPIHLNCPYPKQLIGFWKKLLFFVFVIDLLVMLYFNFHWKNNILYLPSTDILMS